MFIEIILIAQEDDDLEIVKKYFSTKPQVKGDIRNMLVEMSMSTGNYQFIAKMFLSDNEINEIINNKSKMINNNESTQVLAPIEYETTDSDIERIDISTNKFDGIALVIKDPKRVKVGYSENLGVVGETVSYMANRYNAIAAINGGGYKDVSSSGLSGGTGGEPLGILISNGEVLSPKNKDDYYKEESSVFSINSNGELYVGQATVNDLINMDSQHAISFSPTLVVNGNPYISETTLYGINPRTAIGQKEDGSIILLVIDGRQGFKFGATLEEVQEVMLSLGAFNAMCLDGGGSTAMYYDGEIINNPSNLAGERCVPDIIYVE